VPGGLWLSVRPCETESDLASFRNNTWSGGGTLELADGRSFRISTNFWQTRLELISDRDEIILSYTDIGGFFRRSANMTIESQSALLPELPWIVMLSWYLVVMMYRDSAAAASAAA